MTSQQQQIIVEVVRGREIIPLTDPTWDVIQASAQTSEVFYLDEEGDEIKVTNEQGVEEAFRWAKEQGMGVLRLTTSDDASSEGSDWLDIGAGAAEEIDDQVVSSPPPLAVGPALVVEENAPKWEAVPQWEEEETDVDDADDDDVGETPAVAAPVEETPAVVEEHAVLPPFDVAPACIPVEPTVAGDDDEDAEETPLDAKDEEEDAVETPLDNDDNDDDVAALVEKLWEAKAVDVDVKQTLLRMAGTRPVVDFLSEALRDAKLRAFITTVARAELESATGSKVARVRLMMQFGDVCARLIRLFPDAEALILSLAGKVEDTNDAPPVVEPLHATVVCDGCEDDASLAAKSFQRGFRDAQSTYIRGTRFKSVVEADFDICQACEESGVFQASHGPFLKLTTTRECPDVILCAPKTFGDALSLDDLRLDVHGHSALATEFAEFMEFRRQKKAPAPPVLSPPPCVAPTRKCKHTLKAFQTAHANFHCDGCKMRVPPTTTLYGCRVCNFDLCVSCYVTPVATPPPPVVVPEPSLLTLTAPQAKFVCDVTLADGSVVRPGEHLDKTWRIRNVGEDVWPAGTKLVHVGGDAMGGPRFGKEVPLGVGPGEFVNVSVDLVMPTAPGRYTSYWRLTTPHPQCAKFGHRFWVTVNVVPTERFPSFSVRPPVPPLPVMPRAPVPPAKTSLPAPSAPVVTDLSDDFAMAVAQIVDFGFTDMEKITRILLEENGDAGRAIDRLLSE